MADLQHRIRRALLDAEGRPVSFILGSGVSLGAVPSASQMVDYFRRATLGDEEDVHDFDLAVGGAAPERRYQTAAEFVLDRIGAPALNSAVRIAVLQARSPKPAPSLLKDYLRDETLLKNLERDASGWVIPQGLTALGRILNLVPTEARGTILTTNFDPLVEIALLNAGLEPHSIVADDDGAIPPFERPWPQGYVPVAHVHGSWRVGDTLHTGVQITRPRPKLLGSLRDIITSTTCVVLGYGGWDDLLTRAIQAVIEEGAVRDLEVLWACHDAVPSLGVLTGRQIPGRLQIYTGVASNVMLPEIEKAIVKRIGAPQSGRVVAEKWPAVGISIQLDKQFYLTESLRDYDRRQELDFYDGREPTWSDVLIGDVPVLEWAQDVTEELSGPDLKPLAYLVEGPTGEGKSTAIRQIAINLGKVAGSRVYWLDAREEFSSAQIRNLIVAAGLTWICIDDADLRVGDITECVNYLHSSGRRDVRFLLAARDTDWGRSARFQSSTLPSNLLRRITTGGLTERDAVEVTRAWSRCGREGLGRLRGNEESVWAAELLAAARRGSEASLLGALLATRYGKGFEIHVNELLDRLSRVRLPYGGTLKEAYFVICLLPKLGLPDCHIRHLGHVFSMSQPEVASLIISRLGREAATHQHGEYIRPRHDYIAEVVYELSTQVDLDPQYWLAKYVQNAVALMPTGGNWDSADVALAYGWQKMPSLDFALIAARSASLGQPSQLRLKTCEAEALRRSGQWEEASKVCQDAWQRRSTFDDQRIALRRFLREWGRAEGMLGRGNAAVGLQALSLIDFDPSAENDIEQVARGLSGLSYWLGSTDLVEPLEARAWRWLMAEMVLQYSRDGEIREQAEKTLGRLTNEGYEPQDSGVDEGWDIVRRAIRVCIERNGFRPISTYRNKGGALSHTEKLLGLH